MCQVRVPGSRCAVWDLGGTRQKLIENLREMTGPPRVLGQARSGELDWREL